MTNTDKAKFAQLMEVLRKIFAPKEEPTPLLTEIYFRALSGAPIEAVESAITTIISTRKYSTLPKPAEILELIGGNKDDLAAIAWITVQDAIKTIGGYQSVAFEDATIHAVIDSMGGWVALCETSSDEIVWKQKEFERLYKVLAGRATARPVLPGRNEIENVSNGFEAPPPIGIGTKVKQLAGGQKQLEAK
jgi:hypothetical protein